MDGVSILLPFCQFGSRGVRIDRTTPKRERGNAIPSGAETDANGRRKHGYSPPHLYCPGVDYCHFFAII